LQRSDDEGIVRLTFHSSNEECVIRIGRRGLKTYFVINLSPLPQGAPPEVEDLPPERRANFADTSVDPYPSSTVTLNAC
jgi:hypothetical protein